MTSYLFIYLFFAGQCSWNTAHHKQKFTFISANFMGRPIMNRSDHLFYEVIFLIKHQTPQPSCSKHFIHIT